MTATYVDTLPTARDRVRLSLGDTVVTPASSALLSNETIDALLILHGETMAIVTAAEALATRYGQEPDSVALGGKTVTWKDRVKAWLELAARLRAANRLDTATGNGSSGIVRTLRPDEDVRSEYRREGWVGWPDSY